VSERVRAVFAGAALIWELAGWLAEHVAREP
jgi:trimethylamine:corrinoid methyltransferase-like protein